MSDTPRTDFIAHKGYTERTYICEMTELARILETELVAAKAEIENLIWNLAGCSTIAHSGKPTDYSHELARPALHDVNRLAARAEKAEADTKRLDWIASRKSTELVYFAAAGWSIIKSNGGDLLCDQNIHNFRDAIDAAMKEANK